MVGLSWRDLGVRRNPLPRAGSEYGEAHAVTSTFDECDKACGPTHMRRSGRQPRADVGVVRLYCIRCGGAAEVLDASTAELVAAREALEEALELEKAAGVIPRGADKPRFYRPGKKGVFRPAHMDLWRDVAAVWIRRAIVVSMVMHLLGALLLLWGAR